jgi:putative ABC transport system substrate-binding protein
MTLWEGQMTIHIERREFMVTLGSAAAVWPLAARAQQPAVRVGGNLDQGPSEDAPELMAAFREGLRDQLPF